VRGVKTYGILLLVLLVVLVQRKKRRREYIRKPAVSSSHLLKRMVALEKKIQFLIGSVMF